MEMTTTAKQPHHSSLQAKVLKAMGVFSGVQAMGLLCSVVRTKLVAIWIGAAGVGLFGIFMSALDMLSSLTRLGIDSSAVRDVATSSDDPSRLRRTVAIVRRWGLWTAALGAAVTLLLSPWLSTGSFGNYSMTPLFMLLAVAVALQAVTFTDRAVLQGTGQLRRMAGASVWSTFVGVAVSAPLFYWLRLDSILPSILAYSVAALVIYSYMSRRLTVGWEMPRLTSREALREGRPMVTLGIYMTLSSFLSYMSSYLFISWLNVEAGDTEAGLFQSGFTLFNRYIGLLFGAIAVEYYPRLARTSHSPRRMSLCVAHETGIVMWLLMPVMTAFVLSAPLIVRVLYSSEFLTIVPFICIGMAGTIFRALSWCMAFTILARGDGRMYLVVESVSAALYLGINIACYSLWGLTALGWAYIAWYGLYTVAVAVVYRRRYRMTMPRPLLWLTLCALLTAFAAIAVALLTPSLWWLNFPLLAAVSVVAYSRLKR